MNMLSEKELGIAMLSLYHMWLARNDARELPMIENPESTVNRIWALWEEWQAIKEPAGGVKARVVERWSLPAEGWVKANCDGAFTPGDGPGGGGVIMRDHHGAFLSGASRFFPSAPDPEGAELGACRMALEMAKEAGVQKIVVETDCKGVVTKLNSDGIDRSLHGPMVEDIKFRLREFDDYKVQFVRRSANEVANRLAKEGCKNKLCASWMGDPPAIIVELLGTDVSV
jgi:ribonuclease HI